MERTMIGTLDKQIGETAKVMGWVSVRRDHGKLIFFDVRDRSGSVQVVALPNEIETHTLADRLRPEWVIEVVGQINKRPDKMINLEIQNGDIELVAKEIKILNEAKTPLFDLISDGREISEAIRLKYRYLDLRRPRLQANLRLRHHVIKLIRDYLDERSFTEVETPILTKSTPEGARDYIVPSRLHAGQFYALPQSPPQYKQLLMVAGVEWYFRIARCFRDEDTRGARQPEFTQLDLEMSFAEEEDILNLVEDLFIKMVQDIFPEKKITQTPFPRISYKEATEKYGTDKPDLRKNKDDKNELAFAFVVNFPMFEWKKTDPSTSSGQRKGRWDAVHHPFTKIRSADWRTEITKENADNLMAHQYDFVLNGYEIAGGSIREHNPKILETVFEIMGNKKEDIRKQFSHLLEAFEYGVPPHGGIAPGIDRIAMILAGEPNIREVIAFPKTGDGRDLMMDSPSEISTDQLKELHIKIEKQKEK